MVATLDRVAIVEFSDTDRRAVRADRVEIDDADVHWRPAQVGPPWGYEAIDPHGTHARRGRGIQVAPKKTAATVR